MPDSVDIRLFKKFLNQQYLRHWHIHCAKPTQSAEKDIPYLSRYIKRPPLSNARLVHYAGNELRFKYHNHRTNTEKTIRSQCF